MSETNFCAANDNRRFLYITNRADRAGLSSSRGRGERKDPQPDIFAFEADAL